MTKQKELEGSLQKLLFTLKKNREHVDREVLRTYYRKPYYELIAQINHTATAYAKEIVLSGLPVNPDISLDEQYTVINQIIKNSGLLKEMGRSLSRTYDVAAFHQMALQLRAILVDALNLCGKPPIFKKPEKTVAGNAPAGSEEGNYADTQEVAE